ncbi:MAG: hypothetical protein AAFR82_12595, partial [Pseudomonadota bacterium]
WPGASNALARPFPKQAPIELREALHEFGNTIFDTAIIGNRIDIVTRHLKRPCPRDALLNVSV